MDKPDLIEIIFAKAALQMLQNKLGGAYVSEGSWVEEMRSIKCENIAEIIDELVKTNQVRRYQRFNAWDCPAMYQVAH